jgi:dolichyl-phosphate beta-glucosyltransferase
MATVPRQSDAPSVSRDDFRRTDHHPTTQTVPFSLVIPAYNEVERLPSYLMTVLQYLNGLYGNSFEVIVVDDGSHDGTVEMLKEWQCDWPQLQVIRHSRNRGKGAAVAGGMLAASGDVVLFADADGATPIVEERKLRAAIAEGADVACGSRLIATWGAERNRHVLRRLASWTFTKLVGLVHQLPVADSQCGFKMFRLAAAHRVFRLCDESGYLFDIQALLVSQRLGYRLTEVGISWHDVPGSKMCLWRDSWKMAAGLPMMQRRVARLVASDSPGSDIRS